MSCKIKKTKKPIGQNPHAGDMTMTSMNSQMAGTSAAPQYIGHRGITPITPTGCIFFHKFY